MSEKIKLNTPIIVEGKYDKIKLDSMIDGTVVTTEGFGVFKDSEKKLLIRRLADKNGVIVLTDSDGGGLVIRNYINSILPKDKIINLYIPEVKGKEKRKKEYSRAGMLGVEGLDNDCLFKILKPFSDNSLENKPRASITKSDFYQDGFSGSKNSSEKRKKLCRLVQLPENIGSNALIEALNLLYSKDEYKEFVEMLKEL